jgi:hypothetical protein
MKKKIFTCIILLTGTFITVFAYPDKKVLDSFNKEFSNARNVLWITQDIYEKAIFELNGHVLFAYFDKEGKLMSVTRNIRSDQLPVRLIIDWKKHYGKYWISELFEVSTSSDTFYHMKLENAYYVIDLVSNGQNNWITYRSEEK